MTVQNQQNVSYSRYSPEFIRELGAQISAELNQDIIENLKEIKVNNKFIRRKSPIKLKYTMETTTANIWRNEEISGEQKFIENINSNLNKLSETNYGKIETEIITLITDNIGDNFRNLILEQIFIKSVSEKSYSTLYAKLINMLVEHYSDTFKEDVLIKTEEFYKTNIEKKFSLKDITDINYDELCQLNKDKSNLLGIFTFIGSLYQENIVNSPIIIKYIDVLFNASIDADQIDDDIDKYIECLITLITIIGYKLENELPDQFDELIIKRLEIIKNDKIKYKSRIRFSVMDLFDLRKKGWKN